MPERPPSLSYRTLVYYFLSLDGVDQRVSRFFAILEKRMLGKINFHKKGQSPEWIKSTPDARIADDIAKWAVLVLAVETETRLKIL